MGSLKALRRTSPGGSSSSFSLLELKTKRLKVALGKPVSCQVAGVPFNCHILTGIEGKQCGRYLELFIKLNRDVLRRADDMLVGQNRPAFVNNETCSMSYLTPTCNNRVLQPLELSS